MGYFKDLGQYLLPWKAWKNMRKDLSEAQKSDGKNKHKSVYTAVGKYTDPVGPLLGDKWMDFTWTRAPEKLNETLEPVMHNLRKTDVIDRYLLDDDDKAKEVPDFVEAKGGDAIATIVGLIFGGMAAGGAFGGGAGAAGGAGGAGGAAGGASGAAGFSAYGPYAAGYQFAPAASGASTAGAFGGAGGAAGTGFSAYGPYAAGYQFPAASAAAPAASTAPASGGGMFSQWDFGSMDYTDPKTYMRLSQMAPKQQQQQPPPQRRGMMAQNTYKPQTIDQWLEYYGFNSRV